MNERGGSGGRAPIFLVVLSAAVAAAGFGLWVQRRFARFEIAGTSMLPALDPGDFVIVDRLAYRGALPRRGDIVLARDPRDPAHLLVKRVEHVDLHGQVWLAGDNAAESTDSRDFGPVAPSAILGRVRWRYWPPGAWFRVR